MTALNVIQQPDAAYMLVDGAVTNIDGVLIETRSKFTYVPLMSAVVAWTGFSVDWHDSKFALRDAVLPAISQVDLLRRVQTFARTQKLRNIEAGLPVGKQDLSVMGISLNHENRQPEAWLCKSDDQTAAPKRVHCVINTDGPGAPVPGFRNLRPADCCDPCRFTPARDGWRLLEAQRRTLTPGGCFTIGGFAELVSINQRADVSVRRIGRWNDRLGSKIRALRMRRLIRALRPYS